MARTVEEGFRLLHERLTPTATESQAAKSHRESIKACLESNFAIRRFFPTGSFGNATSVHGHSDVDYFASIHPDYQQANSANMLAKMRDVLRGRFPTTGVKINSPAVEWPFGAGDWETFEVVPAYFVSKDGNGNHTYKIPDGAGGWLQSSPDKHNAYVQRIHDSLGRKVKPLIRFVKAWKYYRDVPLLSFYLEMRVAKYAAGEKSIVWSAPHHRTTVKGNSSIG